MIAIDANVIVRYLVADDPEQFRRATALIEGEPVLVSSTVALEVEWVLGAIYRRNRTAILGALRRFSALPTVAFEDMGVMTQALDWAERGMDFADALHLASATACDAFATFDRALARTAAKAGAPAVREP